MPNPRDPRVLQYRSMLMGKKLEDDKSTVSIDFKLSSVDAWAKAWFGKLSDTEKKSCYVRVYEIREIFLKDIVPDK